jgi:GAF domain-containing protein
VAGRRTGWGLAAQMSALMLAVVSVTVLVASVFASAGVYRMLRGDEAARLTAYRQIILDDLTARLTTADRIVDSVATAASATSENRNAIRRTVTSAANANVEYFDLVMTSDASGNVIAAAPAELAPRVIDVQRYYRLPLSTSVTSFTWQKPSGGQAGRVWIAQSFGTKKRRSVLVARLRAGFTQLLVNDIASAADGRSAVLFDSDGNVIAVGKEGPRVDLRKARFATDGTRTAMGVTVGLTGQTAGPMSGYWADVPAAIGLGWRVVVAEPQAAALMRTRSSLLPAALTFFGTALLAIWAMSIFGARLVKPLREFERSARAVASGALVKPFEVDRDDEVGRLAEAFNSMTLRLNALRELSALLSRSSRLDEVLDGTLAATAHLLGASTVSVIFLLDDNGTCLDVVAVRGVPGLPQHASVLVGGSSWPAQTFRVLEPRSFTGGVIPSEGCDVMRAFADAGIRSGLAIPLVTGEEAIGVLGVMTAADRSFSEAETEMLATFSAQAAVAIENSRLFEEERASRREAEALREVAEELESSTDLAKALDDVAGIAAELLDAECAGIAFAKISELGLLEVPDGVVFDRWAAVFEARAMRTDSHDPLVIVDKRSDPLTLELDGVCGDGPLMAVPLVQGEERRGVLILECRDPARGFTDRQLALAATIGREVSLALENAYLLQKTRGRAANLETIFRISQAVSSSLQSTVVLNRVLDVVQKIFSAEGVSLMTYDTVKGTVVTAMARGIRDRDMLYYEVEPGGDLPGMVFDTAKARVVPALAELDTPLSRMASNSGFRSLLAVPLLARGRSIGVLSVYSTKAAAFDAEDVELLQTFGSQAALAIDTAKLYGREHRVASVLQRSILPEKLPTIEGLETASVYRPSAMEGEIGGDYYDVFPAPDGRIVLAIADVAGKGVFAATKTSMIRYSLRGMVSAGLGPADAMGQLNSMVAEAGDHADIVTVWVGYLDIGARTIAYADAGHPAGLLLQPEKGRVEELGPTGPVLGGVDDARYGEAVAELDPGATVLLYTDGVTEARHAGRFFGGGRVVRALKAGGTPAEVAERLMASVDRFAVSGLRDDAAVLVVRLAKEG